MRTALIRKNLFFLICLIFFTPALLAQPAHDGEVRAVYVARALNTQGFILFSYDFTARPSELYPDRAYLERIRKAAF